MRFTLALIGLFLASPTLATFNRDVVSNVRSRQGREKSMNNALLEKAVPLRQYEENLAAKGMKIARSLAEDQYRDLAQDDNGNKYSFSGYSLKYAKCQPVQYFSEDAIKAGEHSPMITEDIVILRLCPTKSCSSSSGYGCQYNYAEYAVSLSEYLKVMFEFAIDKKDNICNWCEACRNNDGRRLGEEEDNADNGNEEENNDKEGEAENQNEDRGNEQENQQENNGEGEPNEEEQDVQAEEEVDAEAVEEDAGDDAAEQYVYEGDCADYYTYCANYDSMCAEQDDDSYLDLEAYMDYLDCVEVDYKNYAYFVRPRCDGSTGTIQMAVYLDNYCVQKANVNITSFGLGFNTSVFSEFYSGQCIDCSESEEPPYFEASSQMCNNLHANSAKCTSDLLYDLFGGEETSATECSFIESIRFGTYDSDGQLSSASSSKSYKTEVATSQKIMLSLSILLCAIFIVYACYLHHAMTNLLIKSLSHRELLPPSRGRRTPRRRSASNGSRRMKKGDSDDDDPDWHGTMT